MTDIARSRGGSPLQNPSTHSEVAECIRVLERLLAEPDALAQIPEEQRRALLIAAGKLSRPIRHERERITKAIRRYRSKQEQQADLELRRTSQIRGTRTIPRKGEGCEDDPLALVAPRTNVGGSAGSRRLHAPQTCYICKRDYIELHRFYDAMCPECAEFNFRKRMQSANLDGRVALITGARIKIGFVTTLMLLRAGARVIGTTRFPHDAAARFAREPDYDVWRDRLSLYGLDLRFTPSVELFAAHIIETSPRLDFLINNAAQTVHRPIGFFAHLRETEDKTFAELPARVRPLLALNHEFGGMRRLARGHTPAERLVHSAAATVATAGLGQALPALYGPWESTGADDHVSFPPGRLDPDGQQLDLRENNSWRMKAADVSTPELIEVHLVNAIAPFILVARLKELMLKTSSRDKHVVNVSAMEGVFSRRTKTDKHPHTNMAKASLNMLTRTSAKDYVRCGIHMNSVDTGWITDEDPHPHAVRKRRVYDFSPPLDAVDGAARVCDPIFTGFLTGEHPFGQFFKDYRPSEW